MNEGKGGGSMTGEQREQDTWLPALIPPLRHPTHTHGLNDLGECMVELTCAASAWATCIARCTALPVRRCVSTNSATTTSIM